MIFNAFLLATLACVSAAGDISSYPAVYNGSTGRHDILARIVDGYLPDTHEVIAAKRAQYVALANAATRSSGHGHNYYGHGDSYGHRSGHGSYIYDPEISHVYGGLDGYAGLHSSSYDHRYGHGGHNAYRNRDFGYVEHQYTPYRHDGHCYDGNRYYGHGHDGGINYGYCKYNYGHGSDDTYRAHYSHANHRHSASRSQRQDYHHH